MERCFMCRMCFKEATKAANEVIERLKYRGDGPVSISDLLKVVSELTTTEIRFAYLSFSENGLDETYGAMMSVFKSEDKKKQKANIVLNTDHDKEFQRFSLVHELGHLVTDKYTIEEDGDNYTLSAHINYNVNCISDEMCQKNKYILNEQIANVFALKVLMPVEVFKEKYFKENDLNKLADFFGVTPNAVRERALLGF